MILQIWIPAGLTEEAASEVRNAKDTPAVIRDSRVLLDHSAGHGPVPHRADHVLPHAEAHHRIVAAEALGIGDHQVSCLAKPRVSKRERLMAGERTVFDLREELLGSHENPGLFSRA